MEKSPDFYPPVFKDNTLSRKTGTWREKSQTPIILQESDTVSTCVIACPIHQDIRGWLASLKDKDIAAALEKLLRYNPLPASASRVCPSFCERGCAFFRKDFDMPLAINCIERFLGDWALENYIKKIPPISSNKRIAIVGSGPAGLTCAYLLRRDGYYVSVFEKEKKIGGLLAWGIPEDRLPKDILSAEIALHLKGVDFCPGFEINESNFEDLRKESQAIFLAPGYNVSKKLGFAGENFQEVIPALTFLKQMLLDQKSYPLNRPLDDVVIVGGGNTAMDCARVAKAAGIQRVRIFHRRSELRANRKEQELARNLDIDFRFSTIIKSVWRKDLRRPSLALLIENRETKEISEDSANLVVVAIGQEKEDFWQKILRGNDWEALRNQGIFLGGDFQSGPKSVSHAVGSGKEAAKMIAAYLEEKPYLRKMRSKIGRENIKLVYFKPKKRIRITNKPSLKEMISEAKRCFSCGLCRGDKCWEGINQKGSSCYDFCPEPAVEKTGGSGKSRQINYDYCKGCGICVKECPRGVIILTPEEKK